MVINIHVIAIDQINKPLVLKSPIGPLPVNHFLTVCLLTLLCQVSFYCVKALISDKTNDLDTSYLYMSFSIRISFNSTPPPQRDRETVIQRERERERERERDTCIFEELFYHLFRQLSGLLFRRLWRHSPQVKQFWMCLIRLSWKCFQSLRHVVKFHTVC